MEIAEPFEFWISTLFHPDRMSKTNFALSEAFELYYIISIIPMLVFLALWIWLGPSVSSYSYYGTYTNYNLFISLLNNWLPIQGYQIWVLIATLMIFWIAIPILVVISSAITHVVGSWILKVLDEGYSKTFNATLFSIFPLLLLSWIGFLAFGPGAYGTIILLIVMQIWSYVILVISLANQHKTKRVDAAVVLLISGANVIPIMAVYLASLFSLGVF